MFSTVCQLSCHNGCFVQVSTECDAHLSLDTQATIDKACMLVTPLCMNGYLAITLPGLKSVCDEVQLLANDMRSARALLMHST